MWAGWLGDSPPAVPKNQLAGAALVFCNKLSEALLSSLFCVISGFGVAVGPDVQEERNLSSWWELQTFYFK